MQTEYKINVPKDDKGYTHRLCSNCEGKFGIRSNNEFPDTIHCPYCDKNGSLSDFNIQEQFDYAIEEGKHQIFYDVQQMFQNDMKKTSRNSRGFKFKPARLHRTHAPIPVQSEIPSDMNCSVCNGEYVIYGIASRCAFCASDDIRILDANLSTVMKELDSERELRRNYIDLVTVFQNECRYFASGNVSVNFQNIDSVVKYFNKSDVNLLEGIDEENLLDMRTVFEKRHAGQHRDGTYDERYINTLQSDPNILGQKVTYSKNELISALKALAIVSKNLRNNLKKFS